MSRIGIYAGLQEIVQFGVGGLQPEAFTADANRIKSIQVSYVKENTMSLSDRPFVKCLVCEYVEKFVTFGSGSVQLPYQNLGWCF
jgi:hypothetical protein